MVEDETLKDLKEVLIEKVTPIFKEKGSYSEGLVDGIIICLDARGLDKPIIKEYLTTIIKEIVEETK